MRVLWWSNHPTAPSGYGTQTALWCRRLRDAGHDVVISSNWAGEPRAHTWDGIPVLPPGEDRFAQDSLARDIASVDPDLVWCLYDAWAIKPEPFKGRLAAFWAPVDHNPVPPRVKHAVIEAGAVPVAYSKFAHESFAANGIDALYVPHGIDTDVYQPRDRAEARRRMGIDDNTFLVGMVAANKSGGYLRKGWDVAFEAFAAFARAVPEALLYCHTRSTSQMGADLEVCAKNYDVPSQQLMWLPAALFDFGITDEQMSWMYSAFDVLLSPSLGEGFGLPVLEAQACGTPVIVTDASAQSELCGAGWAVRGHRLYDMEQASDWCRPFVSGVAEALVAAYDARGTLGGDARKFAEGYDVARVWDEYWTPALARLEAMIPSTGPLR